MGSMDGDDHVAVLAQNTIHHIDALIGELAALNTAYKRKLEALTRLERRELPDPIPGLHDLTVSVRGTKHSVHRLLKTRAAILQERGDELDAAEREERDEKSKNDLRACGLATHQDQWDAIKRSHGLLSFRRRFTGKTGTLGPTIDAVVENGSEWLKVLSLTEKKLVYQLAQQGWHPDDSSDGEDSDASDDDDSGIAIIKVTKQLVQAARLNRCSTRIPRIRLVVPHLTSGGMEAIDKIIDKTRKLGISKKREGDVEVIVDCAESPFLQNPIPPLDQAFANLFRDTNLDRLTPVMNLELTLILSLVSDITHAEVEPKEWYSRQTISHIEDERHAPGVRLHTVLNSLRSRRLECTQEVAREFRNVVDDLGTESTKARALIFFGRESFQAGFDTPRKTQSGASDNDHGAAEGDDAGGAARRKHLVEKFRELSIYPIPDDLQLPIQIVGEDEFDHKDYQRLIEAGKLPPVAAHVWEKLDRSYNRSCHLWGWLQDITTISSNNLNTRLIDATVDKVYTQSSPRLIAPNLLPGRLELMPELV